VLVLGIVHNGSPLIASFASLPQYVTEPAFGAACALASAFFWALTSLLVRRLGSVCSMVTINAVRITASGAVLLAISLAGSARAELAGMSAMTWFLVASSTVLAAGIGDSIFFECTRVLGLGRAMTLSMTYPLMAAAFAAVFLGEPITLRSAAGAVITLAGLVLIVSTRHEDGGTHRGYRRAVIGSFVVALTWALSAILMKPPMRELSPLTAQGIRLPIVAAFLWLTPWSRAGLPALCGAGRAVVTPLVVLSALTAVSSMTWIAGLKYSDVVVATVLSSTSPMFALVLGAMFLGERLTPAAVVGALLTVAGIVVLEV
jgi:DME family drug/metabolite transporter